MDHFAAEWLWKAAEAMPGEDTMVKHPVMDVAFDSEEEPPENSKHLSWRLASSESHSDWTIEIVTKETDKDGKVSTKTGVYHVHKHVLATGPRKSEYFARVFHEGGRFAESKSNTSRIELHEIAARAFPDVLDYVYAGERQLNVSTMNAAALHYLGGYFEMRRLRWEAKQFWKKDLGIKTCGRYYCHAKIFEDEKILKAAAKTYADSILQVDASLPWITRTGPDFWLSVLEEATITSGFSRHVSTLLAKACSTMVLDGSAFEELTSKKYLPEIHFNAALKLVELEQALVKPDAGILTCLQKRCAKALSEKWQSIDNETTMVVLQRQRPLFLSEVLSKTIHSAKEECSSPRRSKVRSGPRIICLYCNQDPYQDAHLPHCPFCLCNVNTQSN